MLRNTRRPINSRDSGLTLVELLIGITITALIASVLFTIGRDASKQIDGQISGLRASQAVIKLGQKMRYDIAGSVDLYVYGSIAPTTGTFESNLCSSWRQNPVATRWTNVLTTQGFVRTLASIRVKELALKDTPTVNYTTQRTVKAWLEPRYVWVGYEIRNDAQGPLGVKLPKYSIWRVTCEDVGGSPSATVVAADAFQLTSPEQILELGSRLDPMASGQLAFSCEISGAWSTCPVAGVSASIGTTFSVRNYSFAIPYAVSGSASDSSKAIEVKALSDDPQYRDPLLQRMTRRINN